MVRILSTNDVASAVTMPDVISALEQAHAAFARQQVVMPVRLRMRYDDRPATLGAMLAFIQPTRALGIKTITNVASNAQRGLPLIHALITLFDAECGVPLAVMDGGLITAMRTAAASGLATRLLARDDASVLAIIGAGVQGHSHLTAMLAVRPIREIRFVSRTAASASRLADAARECAPHARVTVMPSIQQAVTGADIVVTVTPAIEPILDWEWLRPGAHINGVGSHSPTARELSTDVVVNSRLVVDSREANLSECADILVPIRGGRLTPEQVDTELGEIVIGVKPGRRSPDEVTLYKSVGIALQDVATAQLVYQRARERELGVDVAI